jgi:hypothetical protein
MYSVPFIFLQQAFYSAALTPLPTLYVPEILPTVLRAKGVGLYNMTQHIAQTCTYTLLHIVTIPDHQSINLSIPSH